MSLSPIIHWTLTDAERTRIALLRSRLQDLAQRCAGLKGRTPPRRMARRWPDELELEWAGLLAEVGAVCSLAWGWLWDLSDPATRARVGVPQGLEDDGETPADQVEDALHRLRASELERLRSDAREGRGDHLQALLSITGALLDGEERQW